MKWFLSFFESIALAREATALTRQNRFEEARRLMTGQKDV
jgi:hypothetical protein